MGRAPCCDKSKVKRGPWSPEEDATLKNYLGKHGNGGNWIALPSKAGLKRCGKSCRLRWLNYLRPDIKHGGFTEQEDNTILSLYHNIGSRWSIIASQLPGRTDNDVKNHWNTKLKKKIMAGSSRGDQPVINQPKSPLIIPKTENPSFMEANSCPILPLLMNEMGNYPQISNQKGLILDQTHETLLSVDNEFPDFGSSHECNNNNSIYNNISHITQQVSSFSTPSPTGFVQDHHQAGGLMGFGFGSANYSHHQLFNGFGFADNCNDLVGQYLGN